MCGRFVLNADGKVIQEQFNLATIPELQARFNIAPTQPVAVITNESSQALTYHRWGLIPSWAKDPNIGSKMINARSETLDIKPSFKTAFKRRRCLIPASGFYEWTESKDSGKKQPYYIHLEDHAVFAFAGLWETWHSPEGDEVRTCTIITGEPNAALAPYHHRMAVILPPEHYEQWLSPDELPAQTLMPLLQPYPASKMHIYPVDTLVNNVRNDSPLLIEPFLPPQQNQLL
jgi:putative SOS response-associated peptidase YedK